MNLLLKRSFATLVVAVSVLLPGVTHAQDAMESSKTEEEANVSVGGMQFRASNVLTFDEATDKDLYAAGSTVAIKNEVNGDVFAAGQDVTVDGTIKGDLRVAGSVVTINGTVEGNVVAAASTVKIAKDAKIQGYVNAYAATAVIDGSIMKAAHVGAEEVVLNGSFGSEVAVEATNTTLNADASLATTLTVTGPNAPTINNEALKEKVTFTEKQLEARPEYSWQDALAEQAMSVFYWFIASALVVAVLLQLLGGPIMRSVKRLEKNTGNTAALGFAVFICVPVAAIVLLITIVGAPLGLLTMVVYGVSLCLSSIPVSIWFGQKLLPSQSDEGFRGVFLQYLAGNLIITIVTITPFVGWIFSLFVMVAGLGSYAYVLTNKIGHKKA